MRTLLLPLVFLLGAATGYHPDDNCLSCDKACVTIPGGSMSGVWHLVPGGEVKCPPPTCLFVSEEQEEHCICFTEEQQDTEYSMCPADGSHKHDDADFLVDERIGLNYSALYTMVSTGLRCTREEYDALAFHGNHCGLKRNGVNTVDDIDECCESHEHCYESIRDQGLCVSDNITWHPSLVHYHWRGGVGLGDGGEGVVCEDDAVAHPCMHATCDCDKKKAECIDVSFDHGHACPNPDIY